MKHLALLSFSMAILAGCASGGLTEAFEKIDEACVVGRLSQEQADAINELGWEKCGRCVAKVNDRVVVRECSEILRAVEGRD